MRPLIPGPGWPLRLRTITEYERRDLKRGYQCPPWNSYLYMLKTGSITQRTILEDHKLTRENETWTSKTARCVQGLLPSLTTRVPLLGPIWWKKRTDPPTSTCVLWGVSKHECAHKKKIIHFQKISTWSPQSNSLKVMVDDRDERYQHGCGSEWNFSPRSQREWHY